MRPQGRCEGSAGITQRRTAAAGRGGLGAGLAQATATGASTMRRTGSQSGGGVPGDSARHV